MRKITAALLAVISLISCNSVENDRALALDYIPSNTVFVIQGPSIKEFMDNISSQSIYIDNKNIFENIPLQPIINFQNIHPVTSSSISFIKENDKFHYLSVSEFKKDTLLLDSISNKIVEILQLDGHPVKKITIADEINYLYHEGKLEFFSDSRELIEETFSGNASEIENKEDLEKVISASDKNLTSIFINHSRMEPVENDFLGNLQFANWSGIDINFAEGDILFNGVAIPRNSGNSSLIVFKENKPVPGNFAEIVPTSAQQFYSISYSDFSKIDAGFRAIQKDSTSILASGPLNYTTGAGIIKLKKEKILVLLANDAELFSGNFPDATEEQEYLGYQINSLVNTDFFKNLEPILMEGNLKYYSQIDRFAVFSENIAALQQVIAAYQNKNMVAEDEQYKEALTHLAEVSTIQMVSKNEDFSNNLFQNISKNLSGESRDFNFEHLPLLALQYIKNDQFFHLHGVISGEKGKKTNKIVTKDLAPITTDSKIVSNIHMLENDNSKQVEIAYQDTNNSLHLLDVTGKTLWTKKLDGPILGKIQQIDLYKNGNLQLAFVTENSFEILDRNGKDVKPFPVSLSDKITQQLSVFDYDKKRDYRFILTQGKELVMLDKTGKKVNGFDFEKAKSEILQSPKHVRLGNKDYIIFPEKNGTLKILSRQGKDRITVKSKLDFSETNWFENGKYFVSKSSNGKILKIDEKGGMSTGKDLGSGNLVASENTMVTFSDNILQINGNEVNLDFGLYNAPRILQVNKKEIITITDSQAQKVYFFDTKGNLIGGAPVFGNGAAFISDYDGDGIYTVAVMGDDQTIILNQLKP